MKEYEESGLHISELTIPHTEKTDAGMYTCTASNPYGRDQSTIHFTVQGKFIIIWIVISYVEYLSV